MEGEFKCALPVLEKLKKSGFEAYFVGGSVRDALLGLQVSDVDIATNAYPQEVKRIFKKTVDVGIEHGTVMVLFQDESYEVTTFRTESTYQDYRRPDSVTFVRSLKEDLKRRDFTINAFAVDETGEIRDFFNGDKDLEDGLIRAVGVAEERFNEDALRMMRGVRFSAQLDFDIEEGTLSAISYNASLLEKIAVERIQVEFIKLMLGKARSKGLKIMIETGLFLYCPELKNMKNALSRLATDKRIENERQSWALLIYYAQLESSITPFNPKKILKKWKTSNKMIQEVMQLIEGIQKRLDSKTIDPWLVYRLGKDLALDVESLLNHINGDGKHPLVREVYDQLPIHSKKELDISGHDLMQQSNERPGKWLGDAMDSILENVVVGKLRNNKREILKWTEQHNLIPSAKNEK